VAHDDDRLAGRPPRAGQARDVRLGRRVVAGAPERGVAEAALDVDDEERGAGHASSVRR
jgi:hypothetical protein